MSVVEELERKRERILEQRFEFRNQGLETPGEEQEQFLRGYFNVVAAGASANPDLSEAYLQALVPGSKSAGMPLTMVRVTMVMAAELDARHRPWLINFTAKHTWRLTEIWEA